jgi:hypothetical protein
VDFSNALSVNPNNWAKIAINDEARSAHVVTAGIGPDTIGIGDLDAASLLLRGGKKSEALILLQGLSSRFPNNFAGMKALILATWIREQQGVDPINALQMASSQNAGTRIDLQARQLLIGQRLKVGANDEALALAEGLTSVSDSLILKLALYDAGNILWYRKGETKLAEGYFRRLASLWPKDPLSVSGLATMGEYSELPMREVQARPEQQTKTPSETATSYSLAEGYPNPFNPSTTIRYTIPEDAAVTLIVTDIIGRVVARLVEEHQGRGSYTSTWNASEVASGIYFARLTVTNALGQVKFTKVNKLLLMK